MSRREPARCRACRRPVVFFRSPFTTGVRTFEPDPVTTSHPGAGVIAFPVLGGTAAFKRSDLRRRLITQRGCSPKEADEEINDMPWHKFHTCFDHDQPNQKETK